MARACAIVLLHNQLINYLSESTTVHSSIYIHIYIYINPDRDLHPPALCVLKVQHRIETRRFTPLWTQCFTPLWTWCCASMDLIALCASMDLALCASDSISNSLCLALCENYKYNYNNYNNNKTGSHQCTRAVLKFILPTPVH